MSPRPGISPITGSSPIRIPSGEWDRVVHQPDHPLNHLIGGMGPYAVVDARFPVSVACTDFSLLVRYVPM